MKTKVVWLWFFSDLMITTILSKQPLFTNAGLDSCFYGMSQNTRNNHMQSVHQTTAVYIKVFTTEQNHVRVLMEWGIMLLICRRNIKDIYRLFQSLLLWGEKKVVRSETLTWMKQVEMEHFTATVVAADMQDWKFGCGPVGLKATLQTGSDTGEGEQEVRGRALVFLLVRSHSLARLGSVPGQGRMEGGNRTTKSANDLN